MIVMVPPYDRDGSPPIELCPTYRGGMHGDADLATPARLMGEPARAAMLLALLDGGSLPASDLAAIARVKPSTASAHLAQLVDGGLVTGRRFGRHHYFSLAGPEVANAVEALQLLAPRREVTSYAQSKRPRRGSRRRARATTTSRAASRSTSPMRSSPRARSPRSSPGAPSDVLDVHGPLATRLGIARRSTITTRRPAVRGCLDWTERRPHIAGRLGAHLLHRLIDEGWVTRVVPGDRSLRISAEGRRAVRGARLTVSSQRGPGVQTAMSRFACGSRGAPCTSRCSRSMRASSSEAVCAASVSPSSSSCGTCLSYL